MQENIGVVFLMMRAVWQWKEVVRSLSLELSEQSGWRTPYRQSFPGLNKHCCTQWPLGGARARPCGKGGLPGVPGPLLAARSVLQPTVGLPLSAHEFKGRLFWQFWSLCISCPCSCLLWPLGHQWSLDQSESEWEQEVMGQLGPPHGQSEWGAQVVCWPKGLVWGSH